MRITVLITSTLALLAFSLYSFHEADIKTDTEILENGRLANEGFRRCMSYVEGWLQHRDRISGLIPENLDKGKDIWNAHNAAADNYPFMVLTSYLLDKEMYQGLMLDMLHSEKRLTSRVGSLPDAYSFSQQGFAFETPKLDRMIFGASEYIKDGLIPLTEYIGQSPWNDRMLDMLNDLSTHFDVIRKMDEKFVYGNMPVEEVNGEMLQTLSRVYWMTGDEKYLNWAIKIGDYYLLGERNLLTLDQLRIRDHGCEVISGLSELYATLHYARPEKKKDYQEPLHDLLDRVLEIGRNEKGMFYDVVNPKTGEVIKDRIVDNWGYVYDAYYTVYLLDGNKQYRDEIVRAMSHLYDQYRNFQWEGNSSDGYADAIESAINLYNREPQQSVEKWIDSEMKVMWDKQQPDGVIEGWHGDGNFARTTIMYCLWKTQGTTIVPWRDDIILGAKMEGNSLQLVIKAEKDWNGQLVFDRPRHQEVLHMPIDYPRINQFPEWFTVKEKQTYQVFYETEKQQATFTAENMVQGIPLQLKGGVVYQLLIKPS